MVRIHSPRPILSTTSKRWAKKQPTHLPTQIDLLSESKVPILRAWQTTQPRPSTQDDLLGIMRAHSARQSTSKSEVLGVSCLARKRLKAGSERSIAGGREGSGSDISICGQLTRTGGACALRKRKRSGPRRCQNMRHSRNWLSTSKNTPAGSPSKATRSPRSRNCGRHFPQ